MNKKNKILLGSSILLFIALLILVKLERTLKLDTYIYDFIISIKNDNLTNIIKVITHLGDTFWIVSVIIMCFILFRNKKYPIFITINIIGIVLTNQLLKYLIMRPRPDFHHLVQETGYSFPSGHSMAAFGFYGFFIYLINRSNLSKKLKITFTSILSIIIILVGLSRIYLGVHYVSDVLAGFLVSFIFLTIYTHFIKKYLKKV